MRLIFKHFRKQRYKHDPHYSSRRIGNQISYIARPYGEGKLKRLVPKADPKGRAGLSWESSARHKQADIRSYRNKDNTIIYNLIKINLAIYNNWLAERNKIYVPYTA